MSSFQLLNIQSDVHNFDQPSEGIVWEMMSFGADLQATIDLIEKVKNLSFDSFLETWFNETFI